MKSFWCLVLLVSCVLAEQEVFDKNTQDSTKGLSKKIWTQIKKRLKDYGFNDADLNNLDTDLDDETCKYEFRNGSIIRTHESIDSGAKFINSQIGTSREDCMEECCSLEKCNIAVFKQKAGEHSCYLFDCGTPNICKFTSHPGYTTIEIPGRKTSNKVQEKHEDDLENLAEPPTTVVTTSTTTTTTVSPTTAVQQPAALYEKCTQQKDCVGSWSQCFGGYCVCKDEYHAQDGTCRKDCSKFEFECRNTGRPLAYPQCVAIYNKCDGIPLCKDGSDEENCDEPDKGPIKEKQHPAVDNDMVNKPEKIDSKPPTVTDSPKSKEPKEPPPKVEKPKVNKVQGKVDSSKSSSEDTMDQGKAPPKSAESSSATIKPVQPEPVEPDLPSETSDKSKTSSSKQDTSEESSDKTDDKDKVVVKKTGDAKPDGKTGVVAVSQEIVGVDILSQRADTDENMFGAFYRSNKGAVVALSLGLCITAILLIFVGCRLRNVKKRLRRGRPLNSNEADYLINGMYL